MNVYPEREEMRELLNRTVNDFDLNFSNFSGEFKISLQNETLECSHLLGFKETFTLASMSPNLLLFEVKRDNAFWTNLAENIKPKNSIIKGTQHACNLVQYFEELEENPYCQKVGLYYHATDAFVLFAGHRLRILIEKKPQFTDLISAEYFPTWFNRFADSNNSICDYYSLTRGNTTLTRFEFENWTIKAIIHYEQKEAYLIVGYYILLTFKCDPETDGCEWNSTDKDVKYDGKKLTIRNSEFDIKLAFPFGLFPDNWENNELKANIETKSTSCQFQTSIIINENEPKRHEFKTTNSRTLSFKDKGKKKTQDNITYSVEAIGDSLEDEESASCIQSRAINDSYLKIYYSDDEAK